MKYDESFVILCGQGSLKKKKPNSHEQMLSIKFRAKKSSGNVCRKSKKKNIKNYGTRAIDRRIGDDK